MSCSQRFDALDGLRGLAAVLVVLHHALSPFGLEKLWVAHAQLAVDFFFGLSGFVIGAAYGQRLRDGMGTGAFVLQRLLRLYPLMLIGLLFGLIVQLGRGQAPAGDLITALLFNTLWLPDLSAFVDGHGGTWPLNVALWSLSTEMGLSLCFGLFGYRLGRRSLVWVLVPAALALAALAFTFGGVSGGHDRSSWWAGPVRGIYPFVAGLWLWHGWQGRQHMSLHWAWAPALLLLLLLLPLAASPAGYELVAALLGVPLVVALGARSSSEGRLRAVHHALGRLSFPLYALHYPIVQLGSAAARRLHWDSGLSLAAVVLAELGAATALALLVARHVDEPLRRWLVDRLSAATPGPAASVPKPATRRA